VKKAYEQALAKSAKPRASGAELANPIAWVAAEFGVHRGELGDEAPSRRRGPASEHGLGLGEASLGFLDAGA